MKKKLPVIEVPNGFTQELARRTGYCHNTCAHALNGRSTYRCLVVRKEAKKMLKNLNVEQNADTRS